MDLLSVRQILQEECQVNPGSVILAGVSGGPDSLCLLDVLHRLEYRVYVAHFDHCLRPDSAADAEHVRQAAEARGLPFILGREDIRGFAQSEHLSLEEAARVARYHFLFDAARSLSVQAVAVAHIADDQVETVLMHLLRGSGLSGLRGMAFRSPATEWGSAIPLVRPLLGTWRSEIMDYCQEHGLKPRFDPSNQDQTYYRNRLRHHLIPTLETYNPQARQVIWRMARTLAADHEVLEENLKSLWGGCVLEEGSGYLCFARPAFQALLTGQRRGLLRGIIARLRPALRDIDFSAIERVIAFIDQPTATGQVDLVANLRLFIEGDRVFLADWDASVINRTWPQVIPGPSLVLDIPGEVELLNGFRLLARVEDVPLSSSFSPHVDDPFQAWLDADRLELPLSVRARQPGDRYGPLGMEGHSLKLSDFFINHALQARARPGWPLVCSGEIIAWVPGFQPSQEFCVTPETRQLLHLQIKKKDLQD